MPPAAGEPGDLALDAATRRTTAVITWRVTPGREGDFEAWAHEMTALASRHPGHLGAAWLRPEVPGAPYHVVLRFSSAELLEAWMTSAARRRQVAELAGIATEEQARQSGLETWFDLPGQGPPAPARWKMTVVTFCVIYPLSLLFNGVLAPSLHSWPLWARAAVFPALLVPLLTFVLMPRVSRLLRRWLYGRR